MNVAVQTYYVPTQPIGVTEKRVEARCGDACLIFPV